MEEDISNYSPTVMFRGTPFIKIILIGKIKITSLNVNALQSVRTQRLVQCTKLCTTTVLYITCHILKYTKNYEFNERICIMLPSNCV